MNGTLRSMTSVYFVQEDGLLCLLRIGSRIAEGKYVGAAGGHFEEGEVSSARACVLREMQEELGLTYMFITHDLAVVNHFADDIAVMYLGQLVEKAPAEELFANPMHPYTQALLSAIPVPETGKKKQRTLLKGEISSPINPGDECRFAKRCIYASDECRAKTPELKEVSPGHFVACCKCGNLQ